MDSKVDVHLGPPFGQQILLPPSEPATPAKGQSQQSTAPDDPKTPSSTVSSVSTTSRASGNSFDDVRCQPDPLDPDSIICLGNVTGDNRLGISHFFGRNKKETATIPSEMFPLLCRTHYQEKQYRWKDDPAAIAVFQCDCIISTIKQMAIKVWFDSEGEWWPFWCGFELQQLKHPSTPSKKSSATHTPLPKWLANISDRHAMGQDGLTCIGKGNGVRYSFEELVKIVRAIKSWCKENKTGLPRLEALPITIGMLEEQELEECKSRTRAKSRELTLAMNEHEKARRTPHIGTHAKGRCAMLVSQVKHEFLVLERLEREAKARADSSRCTLPVKRTIKKSATASPDEPADDYEEAAVPSPADSTPGRIVTVKTNRKRRMESASDNPPKRFKPEWYNDKDFGKGDLSKRTRV